MDTDGPCTVELTDEHRRAARLHARSEQSTKYGAYGGNSYRSHYTGRLGEEAAARWLDDWAQTTTKRLYARGGNWRSSADLITDNFWAIEAKSWRAASWQKFGMTIAAVQVSRIARKADVVLVVLIPDGDEPGEASIHGWAPVDELLAAGRPRWTGLARAELAIDTTVLRPPLCFIDTIKQLKPPRTAPGIETGACGHLVAAGHCWMCADDREPWWVATTERQTNFFHLSSADRIRAAHDDPAAIRDRTIVRARAGEAVLSNVPCRFCFPDAWPPGS